MTIALMRLAPTRVATLPTVRKESSRGRDGWGTRLTLPHSPQLPVLAFAGEEFVFQTARSPANNPGYMLFQMRSNWIWTAAKIEFTFLRLL